MSHELHYTSAPRGLKPGSRGFCTVACTAGLPAPLADRLESLSGYRQVFPPNDPSAGRNPVAWSHLRLSVGGKSLSILSRVGFAGLDYTDRTNKYAHHVAISSDERPSSGPAWLLSQPGFMDSSWTGEPRILPSGRRPPSGDSVASPCHAWASTTGDAGWAGVVAASLDADPDRPIYLIFEPGMDLLPLVAEALSLLPPARRWDVTFSTYFTGLPSGVACSLRCVLNGSREAAEARRLPNALVLDLAAPLGSAPESEFTRRAQTGLSPASQAPYAEPLPTDEFAIEPTNLTLAVPPPIASGPGGADAIGEFSLASESTEPSPRRRNHDRGPRRRRRRGRKLAFAVGGLLLIVCLSAALAMVLQSGKSSPERSNDRTAKGPSLASNGRLPQSPSHPADKDSAPRSSNKGLSTASVEPVGVSTVPPSTAVENGSQQLANDRKSMPGVATGSESTGASSGEQGIGSAEAGGTIGDARSHMDRIESKGTSDTDAKAARVAGTTKSSAGGVSSRDRLDPSERPRPSFQVLKLPEPGSQIQTNHIEIDLRLAANSTIVSMALIGLKDKCRADANLEVLYSGQELQIVQNAVGSFQNRKKVGSFLVSGGLLTFQWEPNQGEDPKVSRAIRQSVLHIVLSDGGERLFSLRGPLIERPRPIVLVKGGDPVESGQHQEAQLLRDSSCSSLVKDAHGETFFIERVALSTPGGSDDAKHLEGIEVLCKDDLPAELLDKPKITTKFNNITGTIEFEIAVPISMERELRLAQGNRDHALRSINSANKEVSRADLLRWQDMFSKATDIISRLEPMCKAARSIKESEISLVIATKVGGRTIEVARIGRYSRGSSQSLGIEK